MVGLTSASTTTEHSSAATIAASRALLKAGIPCLFFYHQCVVSSRKRPISQAPARWPLRGRDVTPGE
jgi:hypothetical protein